MFPHLTSKEYGKFYSGIFKERLPVRTALSLKAFYKEEKPITDFKPITIQKKEVVGKPRQIKRDIKSPVSFERLDIRREEVGTRVSPPIPIQKTSKIISPVAEIGKPQKIITSEVPVVEFPLEPYPRRTKTPTPIIPPILPKFGFMPGTKIKSGGIKIRPSYKPTVVALEYGIRTKEKPKKLVSGLGIRPVVGKGQIPGIGKVIGF